MIKFKEKEPLFKRAEKNLDIIVATAAATLLLPKYPLLTLLGGLYLYNKTNKEKEYTENSKYKIYYVLEQYKAELSQKLLECGIEKEKIKPIVEAVINTKYLEEIIREQH